MPNCDPELGAWTEPKWLEGNAREPCGLWHGNLEGWVQFPSCHKDFWADVSQVHHVMCNMGYSCTSSIFIDSRSLLFLEFQQIFCSFVSNSFSSQTWNAPGKCCVCQGSLSHKSPIQNSKQKFGMPFEISNLPVWTQKIQGIHMHLVWLPKIMWGLYSVHYCGNSENFLEVQ